MLNRSFLLLIIFGGIMLCSIFSSCEDENDPPICSISSPSDLELVFINDEVLVQVIANDEDLRKVIFRVNGSDVATKSFEPYEFLFVPRVENEGEVVLEVEAVDNDNQSCISSVRVNVESPVEEGQVIDIEGNVYRTVLINGKEWMAENLKATRLNNGDPILKYDGPLIWKKAVDGNIPSYAWYDNSNQNKSPYGALYNLPAVNSESLCPTGWHVATDLEWSNLVNFVGGEKQAFSNLAHKSWENGKDSYLFSLHPSGSIDNVDYQFYWLGDASTFHTSSVDFAAFPIHWWIGPTRVENEAGPFNHLGASVRCVKN